MEKRRTAASQSTGLSVYYLLTPRNGRLTLRRKCKGARVSKIRFEHVTRKFGDLTALDDISFAVAAGEFVVLVGPSGCGKSTALRLVAGLDEPDTGHIIIGDRDMRGVPPKARGCAMVFQSYALYPHWSVRENLSFPLRLRRVPKSEIDRRVTAIATDLQLDTVLDRRPKALSGGQRQRVALGRAMAADPAIFLFDEPLSNLDAPLRASMRAEIVARQKAVKKTTLYVTHDQAEALTMADRVVVLNHGTIMGIGPPEELYRDPPNQFVATFLGRPAMNLIEGQLQIDGDSCTIEPPGWSLPRARLARHETANGRTVLAGVRPEHLQFTGAGADASGRIQMREFLGDKILYHVAVGPHTVSVLTEPADQRDLNADVRIAPVEGQVLLFDPATGQRLA